VNRAGSRTRPCAGPSAAGAAAASPRWLAAQPALDHVCFAIGRAYYAYLGMLEGVLKEAGLSKHVRPGMGHILFALFEQDDRTIKELVDRVGLSYSTLSGLVSRMKRGGVIRCRGDSADGRFVRVSLTPLGRSLEPRCRAALARVDQIMLAGTSKEQLRSTRLTLQHMTDAMREHEARRRGKKQAKPGAVPRSPSKPNLNGGPKR